MSKKLLQMSDEHLLGVGLPPFKIVLESGEGVIIRDVNGKEYLDLMAQNYNMMVGFGNRKIIEAARQQLEKLPFCHARFPHEPKILLANLMKKITANPLKMLFTVSGGSEANETAIKLTRKMKGKRGGYRLISRLGAYHGATIGATSITGVPSAHFPHEAPLMQGVVFVPMPYCYRCCLGHSYPRCSLECATIIEEYIESLGPETFAGVILEPINCASGVIVPPDGYIKRIKKLCTKFDLILIFDEVVTGFGRTGKMFAYEHYGVTPDILTLGKGMSSGYAAIGGIMVSEEIGRMGFSPYVHGFTMTGSPLANAVALANIQTILDEGLVENAAAMGQYFIKGLSELKEEFDVIGDIRGKGLLLFIEVVKDRETKQSNSALAKNIQRHSLHNGLWFLPIARPRVSGLLFTPALCIQREHIDRGLEILRGAFLKEMHG